MNGLNGDGLRWRSPDDPAICQERDIESAALAKIVEQSPKPVGEGNLILHLMEHRTFDSERIAAIERAVAGLVEVGLLVKDGNLLAPTPQAIRAAGLELGL
ncbi:MAG TPA: hypothetical protein VHZ54_02255 [Solirubrobacterales bacterium]|jgi:hypothetical protein|nr:hypothetical protein [Solirubrobacterales bacterium]